MQNISSLTDFMRKMEGRNHVALLIHNPDKESSRCAFRSITEASFLSQNTLVCIADLTQVNEIRSLHESGGEPALLLFESGELAQIVEGCHESDYFKALINHDSAVSK